MERRIAWLGAFMVLCFVVLFAQLNNEQVVKAHQYSTDPKNPAIVLQKFDQPRGIIQSADGVVLAKSVRTPKGSSYKYERQYPEGSLFGHITGYWSFDYGAAGVEATYSSYLAQHNRPIKTVGDLLTTPQVTDTVTLTLSDKLQKAARQALAGRSGAIVALDPTTGAILAMYANPTFDPNPLAVNNSATEKKAFEADNAKQPGTGYTPASSLAYQNYFPPGSTFKIVTSSATYQYAPKLVNTPMPYYTCIPGGTLGGQGLNTPLCNYGNGGCGGTLAEMIPPSCDTGFALLGTKVGATSMKAEAEAFGFNQQPPIDLPPSPYEVSQFLNPSTCNDVNAQIFLAYSSIGQKCTLASPLQMAMVAAGIANGGVVMTPHVMDQIRDSQNNLVTRYQPKPWHTATSQATAATITKLMHEVVTGGTASGVGFLPQDDVAAKTGTAQVGAGGVGQGGSNATTDWMIAFAPANAPKVALAVVVPFQAISATGAAVAGPVMKAMIEAALAP